MKTIIETDEDNLSGICFEKENKIIDWSELRYDEQVKILNSLVKFHDLFVRFLKDNF